MQVDRQLIQAAQSGDPNARTTLLGQLQGPLYRLCLGLLGNAESARDAVQETALRLIRDLQRFRGDSAFQTWAFGFAINVAREMRRQRKWPSPDGGPEPIASGNSVGHRLETAEEAEKLRQLLDDLPDRQREAIMLRFFEDLSVEETARAMNAAPGTIKATVHQALRSLRERWLGRPFKLSASIEQTTSPLKK